MWGGVSGYVSGWPGVICGWLYVEQQSMLFKPDPDNT